MGDETKTVPISPQDSEFFYREGYLMLPGLLKEDFNQRLMDELDEMMHHRTNGDHRMVVSYPEMGLLTSYPPIMDVVGQLMDGKHFAMHHIHSTRHNTGQEGVCWHQDYEQHPHTNRSHLMVHVFYYLNGLNGEIGDLLILPQSHNVVCQRDLKMLGTTDLQGSLCFDNLKPGTAIVVHSAVWHARRPKPGGENNPRYFIDVSYCQNGVLWPAYGNVDKINAKALEMGLDRQGRYEFVYDSSQFFEPRELHARFEEVNQGSMIGRFDLSK